MDRAELERLDRETLVLRAQDAGIRRARLLTRPELIDELIRLDPVIDEGQLKRTRGFFGRARDLLSKVVERGLHLPDAADRWATALGALPQVPRPEPQAVPTVTLAEIYAAQGHKQRALDTLRRVLEADPDHGGAKALLAKLEATDYVPPEPPLPPETEKEEPAPEDALGEEAPPTEGEDAFASTTEPPLDPFLPAETQEIWLPDEGVTAALSGEELVDVLAPTEAAPHVGTEDRDACVAIPLDEGRVCYVWWQLATTTRQRLVDEPAFFFLRAVSYEPSWDGPVETVHDLIVDPASGEAVVRDLPALGIVRIAIGTREDGVFRPVAHSPAFETAGADIVEWTPEGSIPRTRLDDPRSIASAKRAAARLAIANPDTRRS